MFGYWWKKAILRKFVRLQKKILARQEKNSLLSDEKLKDIIEILKQKIRKEKDIDKYLVPVFALVREIIYRKIGLLLFPTQVFGGIVLHYGNIAQMNTGEGKTLTALLPICLNALLEKPVYVITVNEYLTQRDWKLAQPIFNFFDLVSGFNSSEHSSEKKKDLYQKCNIIYTTGSELAFDYLRNNLVTSLEDKLNLVFSTAFIDEADDPLFDQAQNPFNISQRWGTDEKSNEDNHQKATYLANQLANEQDYKVDEKERELWLTSQGKKKAEKFYQVTNFFSFQNKEINFLLHNALKAKHFYQDGVEYIIDHAKKKIVIIDNLTGRLVQNRVYSSGIQQAVESKEGLPVSSPSKSVATITYQNFFRLFEKIAGMTGTGVTEAEEFQQVYGMTVIVVRPHKKLIRKDCSDLIFWNKEAKYQAIIKRIKENSQTIKRPTLVGSPSVEVSEHLSSLLNKENIFHYKLNAVNHQQEAEIISKAGQLGALTISTNMAGRGTDIVLSEESRKVGGLLVIGVERNFSRRIDDQLCGRSGRQGDPGESQFYISLEDDLIKKYALKEQLNLFFNKNKLQAFLQTPLSGKWFDTMISEAQESIRNIQASYRQYTLSYDLLISQHRQTIYDYRKRILTSPNLFTMIKKTSKNNSQEQSGLKKQILKEVDFAWANYLESLEKINRLVNIKVWLPQDPQEAFFWETSTLFQSTLRYVDKKIKKILLNNLSTRESI